MSVSCKVSLAHTLRVTGEGTRKQRERVCRSPFRGVSKLLKGASRTRLSGGGAAGNVVATGLTGCVVALGQRVPSSRVRFKSLW